MERSQKNRLSLLIEKWIAAMENSNRGFYLSYIVLFCLFFLLFASGLLVNKRGFIWATDGLEQQYMFFIMQGEWLRELLHNFFIDHSFVVPMWTDMVGFCYSAKCRFAA